MIFGSDIKLFSWLKKCDKFWRVEKPDSLHQCMQYNIVGHWEYYRVYDYLIL